MKEKQKSFEEAFARLEAILDLINEGKLNLEESLELFEEGNELISTCDRHLNTAQQKIEKLVKDKKGDLLLDENQKPQTEPLLFESSSTES